MQTPGLLVNGGGVSKSVVERTEQECIKKVEDIEKAGATCVILFPIPIDGDYDRGVRSLVDTFGS